VEDEGELAGAAEGGHGGVEAVEGGAEQVGVAEGEEIVLVEGDLGDEGGDRRAASGEEAVGELAIDAADGGAAAGVSGGGGGVGLGAEVVEAEEGDEGVGAVEGGGGGEAVGEAAPLGEGAAIRACRGGDGGEVLVAAQQGAALLFGEIARAEQAGELAVGAEHAGGEGDVGGEGLVGGVEEVQRGVEGGVAGEAAVELVGVLVRVCVGGGA
jgi:hypothetical protein